MSSEGINRLRKGYQPEAENNEDPEPPKGGTGKSDIKDKQTQLKPCPKCGFRALFSHPIYIGWAHYKVFCTKCNIETGTYPSKDAALESWNERAEAGKASEAFTTPCNSTPTGRDNLRTMFNGLFDRLSDADIGLQKDHDYRRLRETCWQQVEAMSRKAERLKHESPSKRAKNG